LRLPDLLIVDGGKGQLARAMSILEQFELTDRVPVASLAKQQEEIFIPGRSDSILLPRQSQGLYLIQRVRDEAHRFAITSHRQRRDKMGIVSRLDAIPGIGPARRKALLAHFGSIEAIQEASLEQLQAIPGVTAVLAQAIKEHLE
jgi:excinuclease ABC subunit C